ncbi:glycosyltransferase family 2 protein [Cyanobacterium sp. IPPAS B-1200]|uniref:glycosyltransferase family 2 protein n=1 Tax=Cyanobacterium sp. IPPAS B-1200 TaxID=1562720 RepID=UPI000852588A|nr:hypothetical protein A5482_07465 [Cyanobacterium sp. IPPAS B-1200]
MLFYLIQFCKYNHVSINKINDSNLNLIKVLENIDNNNWIISCSDNLSSNFTLEDNLIDFIQKKVIDNYNIFHQRDFCWLIWQNFSFPELTAHELSSDSISWIGKVDFIQKISQEDNSILGNNYQLLNYFINNKILCHTKLIKSQKLDLIGNYQDNILPKKIMAIIPHHNCNQWLDYCLFSLINQSYKLTDIVVIDDKSTDVPINICSNYPEVTLLKSNKKVGPYQIIQSVINDSNYDYYLFQDADDWSMVDRLRISIELMDKMGADMVGTQEYRVDDINHIVNPVAYPLNVNGALQEKPGHPLLHPTSLIKRSAFLRVNGFANALLYGADTEFLLRSHFHLKIYNSPEFGYFRRKRNNSLTTSPITGLGTPHREKLLHTLKAIAYNNYGMVKQGKIPSTIPLVSKPCETFEKIMKQTDNMMMEK